MNKQISIDKKTFFLTLVLVLITLILGGSNKYLIFLVGTISWFLIYKQAKRNQNMEYGLIRILILSVPLSFSNVFGSSYGDSNLSWFNIFILLMICIYIFRYLLNGKVYFDYLSLLSLILIILGLIPVLVANDTLEGFKQYINILVLFILVTMGSSFRKNITDKQIEMLKFDYIISTMITGIGVFVQIFFVMVIGEEVGNYGLLGGYRHAFGFLFGDYSFLSLYLASGAMMMYFLKDKYSKRKLKLLIGMAFLLLASILTSARTGIVAFIVIFAVYSVLNILYLTMKGSIKGLLIIILNLFIVVISYILVGRTRSVAKFSDSGRTQLNVKAFEMFLENPLLGIGFGSGNYIGMLPHNMIFQFLAQGGILFTFSILLYLAMLIYTSYKKDKTLFVVLLCVLFGAMFIPNIFNSRFLPILALLISISI